MKLVVVESPAKVKTISKYLGKGYKVTASMGHFVDLPKKELGVDVDKDFKPNYVVTNRKAFTKLKKDFKGSDTLIIASDLDREGEAIGWHVAQRLGGNTPRGKLKDPKTKLERIVFTSITKEAVGEAINNPRKIDYDRVDAQQTRRILDRLVGYTLSPLLWKKIQYGLSAGRVQSVAVRLVVDREEERDKFKPKEYWSVEADVKEKKPSTKVGKRIIKSEEEKKYDFKGIRFELIKIADKKVRVRTEKEAKVVINYVDDKKWIVSRVFKKQASRYAKPPFITSTLQRTVSNMFGYTAKKTMSLAQKLYESGHITYMRTDSFNLVKSEVKKIRSYVGKTYGEEYINPKVAVYKSKAAGAQEAHEAIRPTKIAKSSSDLKLSGQAKKLYDLIRNRTIACQMSPAKVENTTVDILVGKYLFETKGQRIIFDGYLKVSRERVSENILPKIEKGQTLYPKIVLGIQHFTSPPPRYSEASLIKMLEKYGIGRPSTYAPIISTILARKYVIKDRKYFIPTDMGKIVTKLLKQYFKEIVDTGFTAEMEKDLDEIADGKRESVEFIRAFYKPFIKEIKKGEKNITRDEFKILGPSRFKCPECKKKMVKKVGRFGVFLSCSNFPECKGMRSLEGQTEADRAKETAKEALSDEFIKKYLPAPKGEDGKELILKTGRFGKFWAHPDYPKVKETQPLKLKTKCPECKEPLVERKGRGGTFFIGCSGYPKCRYIKPQKKIKKASKKK